MTFFPTSLLSLPSLKAERNRIRNAKKAARRKARKQKLSDEKLISKLQPGLGLNNPYEKRKLREELQMARASGKVVVASESKVLQDEGAAGKEYQTSTKFFQKMQQNVESMIRGDGEEGGTSNKRRKGLDGGQVSSAYKL
jgi:U3 small nucleolar RNA-associated protein MPP10